MANYSDDILISEKIYSNYTIDLRRLSVPNGTFSLQLGRKGDTEREKENDELAKLYYVLAKIMLFRFSPSSVNDPYLAHELDSIAENLTDNDLDILEKLAPHCECLAIKARIADIRWLLVKPKNYKDAIAAIENYSEYPVEPVTWNEGTKDFYERALCLGLQLRKGAANQVTALERKLLSSLEGDFINSSPYFHLQVANLLFEYGLAKEKSTWLGIRFLERGQYFIREKNFNAARSYLLFAADRFGAEGDEEQWLLCKYLTANSWELEAEEREHSFVRKHFYENAFHSYTAIPTKYRDKFEIDSKILELRNSLRVVGQKAVAELPVIKMPSVDVSESVKASIEYMSGLVDTATAIQSLALICKPITLIYAEESLKSQLENTLFTRLFSTVRFTSDGRSAGRSNPLGIESDAEESDKFTVLVEKACHYAEFVSQASIIHGLNQLLEEHRISFHQLLEMCKLSPFVPTDRVRLFARGLYLGFEYDFATAIHMLVPQWEHIVRNVLNECSVATTVIKDSQETEIGLSKLLDKEETAEIFDQDLLFEMKALLVHWHGPNLRNNIAHGLISTNEAGSYLVVYWWWRSLRLIVMSLAPMCEANTNIK